MDQGILIAFSHAALHGSGHEIHQEALGDSHVTQGSAVLDHNHVSAVALAFVFQLLVDLSVLQVAAFHGDAIQRGEVLASGDNAAGVAVDHEGAFLGHGLGYQFVVGQGFASLGQVGHGLGHGEGAGEHQHQGQQQGYKLLHRG